MLPALATIGDLEARLGKPVPATQSGRAQAALADASTLVRSEAGLTWVDDVDELTAIPDVAFTVTLAVALRCYTGESVVDENSLGAQMVNAPTRRPLYLTQSERRLLAEIDGGTSDAFSISMLPADVVDGSLWV